MTGGNFGSTLGPPGKDLGIRKGREESGDREGVLDAGHVEGGEVGEEGGVVGSVVEDWGGGRTHGLSFSGKGRDQEVGMRRGEERFIDFIEN